MTVDRRMFLTLAAGGVAAATLVACGASGDSTGSAGAGGADDQTSVASAGGDDPTTSGAGGVDSTSTSGDPTGTWVVSGPADRDEVALTFHTDGPLALIEAVLDIVEARDIALTAFVVGSWLDANPAMGDRLLAGGHELANHSYTHPGFEDLTPAQMQDEIERCRAALDRHAGSPGRWFRPSGTDNGIDSPSAATLAAAGAAGYTAIGYDVDPVDYRDPGARAVTDRTLAAVVPGSIVSLHMGHQGTIDALPALLDGLAAKQLTPVSVGTLLGS